MKNNQYYMFFNEYNLKNENYKMLVIKKFASFLSILLVLIFVYLLQDYVLSKEKGKDIIKEKTFLAILNNLFFKNKTTNFKH